MHKVTRCDLLILDDFGLRPITPTGADDLYEIIHCRYERTSTILTSNRSPAEWPEVFGDSLLASAALDRLTHHARVTVITGESYRQQSRRLVLSPVEGKENQPQQDTVSQTPWNQISAAAHKHFSGAHDPTMGGAHPGGR